MASPQQSVYFVEPYQPVCHIMNSDGSDVSFVDYCDIAVDDPNQVTTEEAVIAGMCLSTTAVLCFIDESMSKQKKAMYEFVKSGVYAGMNTEQKKTVINLLCYNNNLQCDARRKIDELLVFKK